MEKLTFGKYKGKTFREILIDYEDVSYILWLNENVNSVDIPDDILIEAKINDEAEPGYDLFHDDAGDRI